jgi:L-asparaginase II
VRTPVFPRSSNKPMQAAACCAAGSTSTASCSRWPSASHSASRSTSTECARSSPGAGLDESALQTPPDLPIGESERLAWIRTDRPPAPVAMNCSGKHAAMLATCVVNAWPTADYRDADHPLQQRLRATLEELAGEPVTMTGVDGCGAPLFAVSLIGLARAFSAVATAPAGSPEGRVAAAIRSAPRYLGGTDRDVTRFLELVPGLVAKDGAEGVYAAALPDGRAVAMKILDGADRARRPVLAAALRRLGVTGPELERLAYVPVRGHGQPVGEVRAAAGIAG